MRQSTPRSMGRRCIRNQSLWVSGNFRGSGSVGTRHAVSLPGRCDLMPTRGVEPSFATEISKEPKRSCVRKLSESLPPLIVYQKCLKTSERLLLFTRGKSVSHPGGVGTAIKDKSPSSQTAICYGGYTLQQDHVHCAHAHVRDGNYFFAFFDALGCRQLP